MEYGKLVRSVGVIGGGSAGYLTALYLKKKLPELDISLLESSRIPVIGVGEATTPLTARVLHHVLGYSMQEFFRETRPTLKLGIRFDWGKGGDYHFNTAFGRVDLEHAIQHTGDAKNSSLSSMLMEEWKVPFVRRAGEVTSLLQEGLFAYHIDNRRFLTYLKRKLTESGCRYLDTEIAEVSLTPAGDAVRALRDTDGIEHRFDLYIDCSGFRSLLLADSMRAGWVDYSSSLKTNRAVIGMRPNPGEIAPYTTSATLKHGWLWNTPMQHEDHLGYVFSGDHCTDDEALDELRAHCTTVNDARVIQFKPGRREASWKGNVVGIGNSFAFIEPLESTGLHMILRQARELRHCLEEPVTEEAVRGYNDGVNNTWDHLRWFVAMHFRLNGRLDTPFWRDCRANVNLAGLEPFLEYAARHGPLATAEGHPLRAELSFDPVFPVYAHDAVLTGCGWNDSFFARHQGSPVPAKWIGELGCNRLLRTQCVGQREALQSIEEHGHPYHGAAWIAREQPSGAALR